MQEIPLTQKAFQQRIQRALRVWNKLDADPHTLLHPLYLARTQYPHLVGSNNPGDLREATNKLLFAGLNELAKQDEVGARILRERFCNGESLKKTAQMIHLSEDQVSRRQKTAIAALSTIILNWELEIRSQHGQQLEDRLPFSSSREYRLFGLEHAIQILQTEVCQPGSPWVVCIIGIGGIGKTALADALTRRVLNTFRFEGVAWLEVKAMENSFPDLIFDDLIDQLAHQLLPKGDTPTAPYQQISHILRNTPHLIIIDNLESPGVTRYVLEKIGKLSNPSKFLLTSRARPTDPGEIYTFPLSELSFDDACDLIQYQAKRMGVPDLALASISALEPIYKITGGNALALKLVISLAITLPLSQILANLSKGHSLKVEEMYHRIYRQAWQMLKPEARTLLESMPLIADSGGTIQQIQTITELPEGLLSNAIEELVTRSLLEVRGTLWERRYSIHRLTETFIRTEVIGLPPVSTESDDLGK